MKDLAKGTWNYPPDRFPKTIKPVEEYRDFEKFLDRLLPPAAPGATSIEIGVWPATFQHVSQNKGYQLHGIDIADSTPALAAQMKSVGFNVGEFHQGDVLAFARNSPGLYDVVASFGFVEHFTPVDDIIRLHARLVKPGGLLLITTPNFAHGLQYWLHWIFDRPNLRRHHLPSMNPNKWRRVLSRMEGMEVLASGYVDFMHLWYEDNRPSKWRNPVSKKARLWGAKFPGSKYVSPFCYILARKTGDT